MSDYYKTKHEHDDLAYMEIEKNTTHSLVAMYLVDNTNDVIYSKPADKIAEAIKLMWSALCGLDSWRLQWVYREYPEIVKLAELYHTVYGRPNRSLMHDIKRWEKEEA